MSAVAASSSRAHIKRLHEGLVKIAYRNTENLAEKYAKQCPSPNTEAEDLAQVVWVKLLDWLQDPAHQETAEGLLEAPDQAVKFMQTFSKCRICDYLDLWFGGIRDARRTLHASQSFKTHDDPDYCPGIVGLDKVRVTGYALTERVHKHSRNSAALCIADIKSECLRPLARTLLDYLIDPPAWLRESFWESRLEIRRGSARIDLGSEEHTLTLEPEQEQQRTLKAYFSGKLAGSLDTSIGPATVTDYRNRPLLLSFGCGLLVKLKRRSLRGSFTWETTKATTAVLDEKIMADFLGTSQLAVREAWRELKAVLATL